MGSASTDLTGHRVEFLRQTLSARFANYPTYRHAIMSVLDTLAENWDTHQGLPSADFDRLNAALVSPFEALLVVPPDRAQATIDQLVIAWTKVRDHVHWI